MNTQTQERKPFAMALEAARLITTAMPGRDQPKEIKALQAAMSAMDNKERTDLVFKLVKDVLEDESTVQPLFAVAREARMLSAAYNTTAISKAIKEGKLTLTDLKGSGLAEIKIGSRGPYVVYHVGHDAIATAATKLRETGKTAAADVLAKHVRRIEFNRELAEAAKTVAGNKAETPAPATT